MKRTLLGPFSPMDEMVGHPEGCWMDLFMLSFRPCSAQGDFSVMNSGANGSDVRACHAGNIPHSSLSSQEGQQERFSLSGEIVS
jgi:hypothetical protein